MYKAKNTIKATTPGGDSCNRVDMHVCVCLCLSVCHSVCSSVRKTSSEAGSYLKVKVKKSEHSLFNNGTDLYTLCRFVFIIHVRVFMFS